MTLYDYHCLECGYFEAWRGLEDILIPCPSCGKTAQRLISLPAAVFTESGGKSQPGEAWRG